MNIANKKIIDVGIIGGGVGGLSLAHFLSERESGSTNFSYKIFEQSGRTGGIIHSEKYNEFTFEHGPDAFMQKDASLDPFFENLNLQSRLTPTIPSHRRSLIVSGGKLLGLPLGFYLCAPTQTFPFLTSPLMSPLGKIRTLMEPWIRSRKKSSDESIEDFVRRRFGYENYQNISQAMLGGIFTGDPSILSLRSCLPRLHELESHYGSIIRGLRKQQDRGAQVQGPRYQMFKTFKRGMEELPLALAKSLSSNQLHIHTSIVKIEKDQGRWVLWDQNQNSYLCKNICLCVPSYVAAKLLSPIDPELSSLLQQIQYSSSAIVNLGFAMKKNLPSAMGFVVPRKEKRNILACGFLSQKFPLRAPKGKHLIRVFLGGAFQSQLVEFPNEKLIELAVQDIENLFRTRIKIEVSSVKKWPQSIPQYTLGHQDRVARIIQKLSSHDKLYIGGNCLQGVGIPDTILKSKQIAKQIRKLGSDPTKPETDLSY